MDPASLASALIGAQTGQLQMAVAAKVLHMQADQDAAIAKMVEAGQQSIDRLANVASGVGQSLDISV